MRVSCTGLGLSEKPSGKDGCDNVWEVRGISGTSIPGKMKRFVFNRRHHSRKFGNGKIREVLSDDFYFFFFSLFLETRSVAEYKLSQSGRWRGLQLEDWEGQEGTAWQLWAPVWVWWWWNEHVIKLSFSVAWFSLVVLSCMSADLEKTNVLGFIQG